MKITKIAAVRPARLAGAAAAALLALGGIAVLADAPGTVATTDRAVGSVIDWPSRPATDSVAVVAAPGIDWPVAAQ
ncbi:hypothetical protein [Streptomyces antimicrobicus]|uniref:Uncharacterized protein n=1 Tax=Streptomyces antimicrobicus TaxID=2883108 RepID=A0ABS8B7R6_9ACTN|nr:hypothetical protein [Streptomyces antimicrobicus]MCB5180664.1 hypothetical protein [Streptomyces antimicrobicus]